ncbi:MAG: PaREP1 family protein, partial [Thermoplasmata archaeon]
SMQDNFIELLRKYLEEAKEYLQKGDVPQSSEKIYWIVEKSIKFLAEKENLVPEEVKQKEKWSSKLLRDTALELAKKLNEKKIREVWWKAFDLHIWGFHENFIPIEDVQENFWIGEWMIDFLKEKYFS